MTPSPIFTAIEFNPDAEDDVRSMITQPLLQVDHGDEEPSSSNVSTVKAPCAALILFGIITGFLIQVISLGAYACMLTKFGEVPEASAEGDWFLYAVLSVLTQVDLVIYVLIWAAFTCTMTKNGMAFIRFQYQAPVKRRSVFILGVFFLVGIVLGAFVAWTMIDLYLGFPIPFAPIATTVVIDLVLCYLMIFCYDLGREENIEDEDVSACC